MNKYNIRIFVEHLDTNYKKLKSCLDSIQNQTYLQKSIVLVCNIKNYQKVFKFRTVYSTDIFSIEKNKFIFTQLKDISYFKYTDPTDLFVYIPSSFILDKNCLKNLIKHYDEQKTTQMNIIPTPKNNTFPYGKVFRNLKELNNKDYNKINTAVVYYQKDQSKWKKILNLILTPLKMNKKRIQKKKLSI